MKGRDAQPAAERAVPAPAGLACGVAWLAGMMLCLWLPMLLPAWLLWIAAVLGTALWCRRRHARWFGAALVGFAWAGLHAAWSLHAQLPVSMEGREVAVHGRVVGLPEPEARRTRFLFRVDDLPTQPAPLRGRLLRLSWYDDYGAVQPGVRIELQAGERWRLHVRVRAPRGLANPGGFDGPSACHGCRWCCRAVRRPTCCGPCPGVTR